MNNAITLQVIRDNVAEMAATTNNIWIALQAGIIKSNDPQLLNAIAGMRENLEMITEKLGR